MATKVKPTRLQITGTPQAGDVPQYVDGDNFQWGSGSSITVVDALNSTSATDALSANQGKVLNDKISDLFGLGKFLSLWDATTGQPDSFPLQTPYTYSTGDYYLVETVSSATPPVNYKPNGSSYIGTASSTPETDELEVGDVYIYDGSTWLLQSNHGKTVTFSNIAGDPYDNINLANALGAKQDELVSGTNIRTINGTSILGSGDITTPVGGDVNGPVSSTDGHLAVFDGNTGKTIKDGGVVPTSFAPGGTATTGYVVTKTADGYERQAPTGGVTSVNSQTGAVTLDADDISDSTTTNKFVTATDKSTWSGKQDALTLPATPTQGHLVTRGADNKSLTDGGAVPAGVPSGGNNGDVLTNVSGTPTWDAPTVKSFTYPSVSDNIISLHDWVRVGKPAVLLETNGAAKIVYVVDKFVDRALWGDDDMIYASAVTDAGVISVLIRVNYVDSTTATVTSVTASSVGGGLQVSPNSTITGIKYVWYGTEADYANLSQYYTDTPGDTEFHTF